nr:hypothetical protein [Morchella crassipes]
MRGEAKTLGFPVFFLLLSWAYSPWERWAKKKNPEQPILSFPTKAPPPYQSNYGSNWTVGMGGVRGWLGRTPPPNPPPPLIRDERVLGAPRISPPHQRWGEEGGPMGGWAGGCHTASFSQLSPPRPLRIPPPPPLPQRPLTFGQG